MESPTANGHNSDSVGGGTAMSSMPPIPDFLATPGFAQVPSAGEEASPPALRVRAAHVMYFARTPDERTVYGNEETRAHVMVVIT